MPHFALNGATIDVAHGSGHRETSIMGSRIRAVDGSWIQTVRTSKESYSASSPLMIRDSADALYSLLQGYGHNFRFAAASDYYSGKGLAGTATLGGGTITAGGASGKFDKRVTFSSATPYLSWTPAGDDALTGSYTISVWKLTATGPDVWTHYLATWDGSTLTEYENGIAGAYSMNFISVTAGVLRLNNSEAASNWDYSDLVALPFVVPTAWIAGLAATTRAFPNRPNVEASGDLFNLAASAPLVCCATDVEFAPVPFIDTTGSALDGGKVSFTLVEV